MVAPEPSHSLLYFDAVPYPTHEMYEKMRIVGSGFVLAFVLAVEFELVFELWMLGCEYALAPESVQRTMPELLLLLLCQLLAELPANPKSHNYQYLQGP